MGGFLQVIPDRMRGVLEHPGLSDSGKVLLAWLLFSTLPSKGRVESATIADMASSLSWSRAKVTRALQNLRDAGMIDFRLPHGSNKGGWVQVLAFYEVQNPSSWLHKNRRRAKSA